MGEKKEAPFPGTFSKNSKNLQYFYRFCFELSLLVTRYKGKVRLLFYAVSATKAI